MLNIRLSRVGKKGHAQYRVVVAEKSSPVKGKSVEQVGSYNPHTKELVVKKDRIEHWISNGAACSDTVKNLFIEKNIIEGDKVKMTFKKKESDEEIQEIEAGKKGDKKDGDDSKDEPKEETTKEDDKKEEITKNDETEEKKDNKK